MQNASRPTLVDDAVSSLAKSPAALIAAIAGVLYALGFAVINSLLAYFGVSDFSGIDPRFVLTGLLFVAYLLLPATPLLVGIAVDRLLPRPRPRSVKWLVPFAVAVAVRQGSRLLDYVSDSESYSPQPPDWIYWLGGWRLYAIDDHGVPRWGTLARIALLYLTCWLAVDRLSIGRADRYGEHRFDAIVGATALASIALSLCLTDFAYHKFRHLRAGYGGAAYGVRSFVLDKKQARAFAKLGLPLDHGVLSQAPVLYESRDSIIFLTPPSLWEVGTTVSFQVSKSAVQAVRWNSR